MVSQSMGQRGSCVLSVMWLGLSFVSSVLIWVEVCMLEREVSVDLLGLRCEATLVGRGSGRVHLFSDSSYSEVLNRGFGYWILSDDMGVIIQEGLWTQDGSGKNFSVFDRGTLDAGAEAASKLGLTVTDAWFDGVNLVKHTKAAGVLGHRVVQGSEMVGVSLCHQMAAYHKYLGLGNPARAHKAKGVAIKLRLRGLFDAIED